MSETVDFANPPVTETMLGAWFAPLQWDQSLLGLYRAFVRDQYPHYEDAAAILAGPNGPYALFPSSRGLFINADRNQLIQVQQTMFYVNWRQLGGDEIYPRYHEQQKRFLDAWKGFNAFLAEERRSPPVVSTCQVCYVNHIEIPPEKSQGSVVADVLSANGAPSLTNLIADAKDLNFMGSYSAEGGSELSIQLVSVLRATDNRKMLQMQLTSNSTPKNGSDTEALMVAFDASHDDLIKTFMRVTSDAARKSWGQR